MAAIALRGIALCMLLSTTAAATEATRTYRLPGGELPALLNALAEQSGIQIIYDAKLLAGHRSDGLNGQHSIASALSRLLRGSGLEAVAVNADTFVIKPIPSVKPASPRVAVVTPPESVTELSRVVVNDIGVRHIATVTAMPVTEITREQIDGSGYATLFDLLKAQPGTQVANQPESMASSSDSSFKTGAAGAAAVALRRLGSKSTLFLVDGRRIAGYGLAQDGTGTVPDLNAIPLAMVERIEILRDGASAIYGSDAIAGVVNIILRHDFSGAEASTYAGVSGRGDAAAQQASVLWGTRTKSGVGLLFNVNYLHSDPLLGSQRDWYSLDQRRQGLRDMRSPYSFPGNYVYMDEHGGERLVALPGCPPQSLSADGVCLLDPAKYTTLQNGREGKSLLGRLDVPFGDSARFYLDLRATDLVQRQRAAPSAGRLGLRQDEGSTEPQPFEIRYSYNDLGPVRERTQTKLLSLDAGASGQLGRWNWSIDAGMQRNRVEDLIDGLVRSDILDLSVDGERYTFGDSPPSDRLRALIAPRVERHGVNTLDNVNLEASGSLFDLPAGTLSLAGGLEVRREGIEQRPGEGLRSGLLLNQPKEYPFSRERTASAAYVKFAVPITDKLDADFAWRVEKSGGFSANSSPTFALRWNPFESLVLRATASAGYRVPTLFELYQPRGMSDSAGYWLPESAAPCETELARSPGRVACFINIISGGNAALRPETSKTLAWGMVWAPSSSFSLSADIYSSMRRDEIGTASATYAFAHPELLPDFAVRNEQGGLTGLNSVLVNLAHTTTRGADTEARWDFDVRDLGAFRLSLGLNYLDTLEHRSAPGVRINKTAGYANTPRLTAVSSVRWTRGDWTSNAYVRYVGSYSLEQFAGSGLACDAAKVAQGKCTVPPFTLVNVNLTYTGLPRWAFTLSVNNVFDHRPRYYDEFAGGYNAAFDDVVGRYFAFRATYRF